MMEIVRIKKIMRIMIKKIIMEIMNILEMIIRMIMKVMNINLLVKIKVMKMVIIKVMIVIMEMSMVMTMLKIVHINVLVRLVSITPGHVKLDWLPPSKSDRRNDNAAHYQH